MRISNPVIYALHLERIFFPISSNFIFINQIRYKIGDFVAVNLYTAKKKAIAYVAEVSVKCISVN